MPEHQNRIAFESEDGIIRLSPLLEDNRSEIHHPGNLTQFAPDGNSVYGYEDNHPFDPFKIAGRESEKGGIVFFNSNLVKEDFTTLCQVMGICDNSQKYYMALLQEADNAPREGFIKQLRIIDRFALRFHFNLLLSEQEYDKFPEQELTIKEAMWSFIKEEKKPWTNPDSRQELKKKLGGSDWAWPALSFGLMVENGQDYIYRIWSRVFYITK